MKVDNEMVPLMPSITTQGKNTMGFFANGELHVFPSQDLNGNPVKTVSFHHDATYGHGTLRTSAISGMAAGEVRLIISIENPKTDTVYNALGYGGVSWYERGHDVWLVKAGDPFNELKFLRYDDEVVAGLFQFKAFTTDGDTMIVTDGRFDVAR